jgi:hypothetical protein
MSNNEIWLFKENSLLKILFQVQFIYALRTCGYLYIYVTNFNTYSSQPAPIWGQGEDEEYLFVSFRLIKGIEMMGLVSHLINQKKIKSEILMFETFTMYILKVVAKYWPLMSFNYLELE